MWESSSGRKLLHPLYLICPIIVKKNAKKLDIWFLEYEGFFEYSFWPFCGFIGQIQWTLTGKREVETNGHGSDWNPGQLLSAIWSLSHPTELNQHPNLKWFKAMPPCLFYQLPSAHFITSADLPAGSTCLMWHRFDAKLSSWHNLFI